MDTVVGYSCPCVHMGKGFDRAAVHDPNSVRTLPVFFVYYLTCTACTSVIRRMHHAHRTTTRRTPSGQRALVGNRVYKITFACEFCGDADGDALGLMLGLG